MIARTVLLDIEPALRRAREMVRALRNISEHRERTGLDGEECGAMAAVAAVALNAADDVNDALHAALKCSRESGDKP